MTSILVAADSADTKFRTPIYAVLGRFYSTLLMREKELQVPPEPAQITIYDAKTFAHVKSAHTVVLFRKAQKLPPEIIAEGSCVAVVDSCNQELMSFVSGTKMPAITCGLSPRDTITLSSMGEDSAVINVQRSLICFDGTVAEPQEIPVSIGAPIDNFALMALACVFILCGDIIKLAHIKL